MINIQGLKEELAARIAELDSTSNSEEVLLLSTSLNAVTEDRIVSVDTVDDLPDLTDEENPFSSGFIFYVNSVSVLVVSSNFKWIGLDGRVLRKDKPDIIQYAWGYNSFGPLGDGTETARSSPVSVVGGITNWSQVSAGGNHSLGVTSNGIAYGWGYNSSGRLGDGTTTARSSPVSVIGGITNWSQVSASANHSLGVTSNGIAYGWGNNGYGRLGDGTTTARSSPVSVIGGITNWAQVSAGGSNSLGVTSNGIAYAWGSNDDGQIGDGTTTNRSSPVSVIGGITNWAQVSASTFHSLGITADGIAYGWGYNGRGRLGDGTTTNRSSPVSVIGGITNWAQVSAGNAHSLGVTSDGIAYAWGYNSIGRLGDGTETDRSSPVSVVGGITNWSQVDAGENHSLGVTSNGIAYGWGYNGNGRLGDGTTTDRSSPVSVIGGITNWAQVSAGNAHSQGLTPL